MTDMYIFTDANATLLGGILVFDSRWFQGEIPEEVRNLIQSHSIAFCKLYPIVMACVLWGSEWVQKTISF